MSEPRDELRERQVRDLLPSGWALHISRQNPPGSPWAATATGPTRPDLKGPVEIAYFGADTRKAALEGLARRLVTDQRPDRFRLSAHQDNE